MCRVKHLNGDITVVPDHMKIDERFTLIDAFSDEMARYEFASTRHYLTQIFSDLTSGPWRHRLDKKGKRLQDLCDQVVSQLTKKRN